MARAALQRVQTKGTGDASRDEEGEEELKREGSEVGSPKDDGKEGR